MSDRSDDFEAQARREGQFLHDQGVRVESSVSQASLAERIPPNSPQPEKANHKVRMSYPTAEHHPTDIPLKDIAKSDQRRQPVNLNSQAAPEQRIRLEHFPQHEADAQPDSVQARQPVSEPRENAQARTPIEEQQKPEQQTARAKVQDGLDGALTATDQTVAQTAAAEKAAEVAKTQEQAATQAPPPQER